MAIKISPADDKKRISIEQYNSEIQAASEEVRVGHVIAHDKVVKSITRWLKKQSQSQSQL